MTVTFTSSCSGGIETPWRSKYVKAQVNAVRLLPSLEDMTTCDGLGVQRGDFVYVVESFILDVIIDAKQGGFQPAPSSTSEAFQPASFLDNFVVDGLDEIRIEQSTILQRNQHVAMCVDHLAGRFDNLLLFAGRLCSN